MKILRAQLNTIVEYYIILDALHAFDKSYPLADMHTSSQVATPTHNLTTNLLPID